MDGGERQIPHPPRSLPTPPSTRTTTGRTRPPRNPEAPTNTHTTITKSSPDTATPRLPTPILGGRTRPRPRRGRSRGRARRSRGPHRSLGSRADVPAAVLGIARALGASHLLQRVHSGCLRLHSADVPRKRLDHAGSFGDHLRVRWRAVPLDGPDGTREPRAGDDDAHLAGDHRLVRLLHRQFVPRGDDAVLLGTRYADRHHALGPLDGDAVGPTGLRRARRTGETHA